MSRAETKFFFDRTAIVDALGKAKAAALAKAGAFVRRSARSSIRSRKRASQPGQAPSSRTGLLRENILFAWDPSRESLFVGPVLLPRKRSGADGRPVAGTVPSILESGGAVTITEVFYRGKWRRDAKAFRKYAPDAPRRARQVRIAPRPYMAPALAREAPKFPELFRNSMTGGA